MVDTARQMERTRSAAGGGLAPELGLSVAVSSGPAALAAYRVFAAGRTTAPAQQARWTELWAEHVNPDVIVATVSLDGEPLLAWPLEVIRDRLVTVARPCGGRHANGNFPAMAPLAGNLVDRAALANAFLQGVAAARPDIDLILLERLEPQIEDLANPFILPSSTPSPNIALACDLSAGFEETLLRHSGKRKRKKHRNHARKFEEQGVIETGLARTPEEIRHYLDAFFAMKAIRFAELGIRDVFAEAEIRAFFHALFAGAPDRFVVHYLKVGGVVRAVTGSSLCGDRMVCEFSGFVPDETENTSPGDYLFFENIAWACGEGLAVHDFSVGDEPYKRLWCDIETVQQDTVLTLSAKGRMAAALHRWAADAKRRLKANPALWTAAKALRRRIR